MTEEEWMDLHHYSPTNKLEDEKEKNNDDLWEQEMYYVLTHLHVKFEKYALPTQYFIYA